MATPMFVTVVGGDCCSLMAVGRRDARNSSPVLAGPAPPPAWPGAGRTEDHGALGTVGAVIAEEDVAGIDTANVTAWLVEHVDGAVGPFRFEIIAGGHSNLTYLVQAADGRRLVLRRPPLGHVLASAHDMGREHRIIAGLQGSGVPVPPALGWCDDPAVNGAPFYVMGFVDGIVVRDRAIAERSLGARGARHASRSLVDTLAAIHAVDLDAAGLADLAKHEGYIERQLKRWYGQWNLQKTASCRSSTRSTTRSPASPAAGPGDDRPRRLPPRQHDRVRRR